MRLRGNCLNLNQARGKLDKKNYFARACLGSTGLDLKSSSSAWARKNQARSTSKPDRYPTEMLFHLSNQLN